MSLSDKQPLCCVILPWVCSLCWVLGQPSHNHKEPEDGRAEGTKELPSLIIMSPRGSSGMLISTTFTNWHNSAHFNCLQQRLAKTTWCMGQSQEQELKMAFFFFLQILKTDFVLGKSNKRKMDDRDHVWPTNLNLCWVAFHRKISIIYASLSLTFVGENSAARGILGISSESFILDLQKLMLVSASG